jgi:maltooligosyltrehalose trehalohydrolase
MTPLLFMGQEWGASSPFAFFTDHDAALGVQVARGRREEFKGFRAFRDEAARALIPDPQAESTFIDSKLRWEEREQGEHARILGHYQTWIALRKNDPVLSTTARAQLSARAQGELLILTRTNDAGDARILVANFASEPRALPDGLAHELLLGPLALRTEDKKLPAHGFALLAESGARRAQ